MKKNVTVSFELSVNWEKDGTRYRERFFVRRGNIWRDLWREGLGEFVSDGGPGDRRTFDLPPGRAVPPYDDNSVVAVRESDIRFPAGRCGNALQIGRFYPRGMLAPAAGVFSGDVRPFRAIGRDGKWVITDLNHPLASHGISVVAAISGRKGKKSEIGGSCIDWLEEAASDGPGLQVRWKNHPTDFSSPGAYSRRAEESDVNFYREKRLVGHIDSQADSLLSAEYDRRLKGVGRVLDLMSSFQSHLPDGFDGTVTGLGLNGEEMQANPVLSEHRVHDLNADPVIPFGDESFDAVVCSLSYEYLTDPRAVVAEAARVLSPGGQLLIGLSNRWFPPKVIRLWEELHPFERIGLVSEDLLSSGLFRITETATCRNWPRPVTDRHYPIETLSDPLAVLSAEKISLPSP